MDKHEGLLAALTNQNIWFSAFISIYGESWKLHSLCDILLAEWRRKLLIRFGFHVKATWWHPRNRFIQLVFRWCHHETHSFARMDLTISRLLLISGPQVRSLYGPPINWSTYVIPAQTPLAIKPVLDLFSEVGRLHFPHISQSCRMVKILIQPCGI